MARINIWDFELPGLKDRSSDIEPNIDHELKKFAGVSGNLLRFTVESKKHYLRFSTSGEALWRGNFRDLNASIHRMATLADTARIGIDNVEDEILLLKKQWRQTDDNGYMDCLTEVMSDEQIAEIDPFDIPQLVNVIQVCRESKSMVQAGRSLFTVSRLTKKVSNDSDRLRKYLAKFDLSWDDISQ